MFLSNFIPWALEAVAQVDAIGEHGQGGGFEDEFLAVAVDVPRPGEGAFFKSLEARNTLRHEATSFIIRG